RAPGATRAGTRPRGRRGTRGGPARATRATGTSSAAGSRRADGYEVAPGVEHAAPELGREPVRREHPLEHLPARAVGQHALLPALGRVAVCAEAADDDELARDPPRLGEEANPGGLLEVAVEEAREHALEGASLERQLDGGA